MSDAFSIRTINVRGLNNPIKAKRMTSFILKAKPSILFLQETHLRPHETKVLKTP
ncbi:UNVERIFIED_CONTAM: hypothetical protein K2H54_003885, partial [Gekko kuhli]